MGMALRLAENARGRTSPNPMVGAVVVKDDRVVAAGWHRKAGTPHAEIHALNMAGELARGATMDEQAHARRPSSRLASCVLSSRLRTQIQR